MLRRVRHALRDLTRELLDRALALRENVDDLRASPASECLRHGRLRIEERRLCSTAAHVPKLSLEYLRIKTVPGRDHRGRLDHQQDRASVRARMVKDATRDRHALVHTKDEWLPPLHL